MKREIVLRRLHTQKERKTGTVLIEVVSDCLNTRGLEYSISPFVDKAR